MEGVCCKVLLLLVVVVVTCAKRGTGLRVGVELEGADADEVGAGGEADPDEGDDAQGAPDRQGHAHLPT